MDGYVGMRRRCTNNRFPLIMIHFSQKLTSYYPLLPFLCTIIPCLVWKTKDLFLVGLYSVIHLFSHTHTHTHTHKKQSTMIVPPTITTNSFYEIWKHLIFSHLPPTHNHLFTPMKPGNILYFYISFHPL